MGTHQLLYSLSLILLIHTDPSDPSEPTEGKSLMKQTSGTWIVDVLKTLLETRNSKRALMNAAGPLNSPTYLPPRSFPGSARGRPKRERPEEQECHLQSMLVRIKDLGLGYNSEETILFKYCTGSCSMVRTNHDLTLSVLLQKSEISALGDPCCRPTRYENVAFLDDSHQWHEVEKLSASSCGCVG